MDRYTQFNLRGDQDELLRRAVRDGFRAAGLSQVQMTQALEWYRDHVRPDMEEAALMASFHNFANDKGWPTDALVTAQSIYTTIRDEGPTAVLASSTPEEDAALIARADEMLRSEPDKYWRDEALQELALEARERQQAAPPPQPDRAVIADQIEQGIARRDMAKYETMMRERPQEYWRDPKAQAAYRDAIERSTASSTLGEQPGPSPAAPEVPPPIAPEPIPAAAGSQPELAKP